VLVRYSDLIRVSRSVHMLPVAPFYGAPSPAAPWPPRPDDAGGLPFLSPNSPYNADVEYTPAGAEQGFRRLLLSRTITLRNARTL
jgi:hypothetical protein